MLLQDLLEQEKREKQEREQQASINNEMANTNSSGMLSEHDFDRFLSSGQQIQAQGIPAQGLLPLQQQQQQQHQQQQQPMMQNQPQQRQFVGQNAPRPQFIQRTISQQHTIGQAPPPSQHLQNQVQNMNIVGGGGSNVGGVAVGVSQTVVKKDGCSVPVFVATGLQKAPTVPPDTIATEQDRQIQINYEQWLSTQDGILVNQRDYYENEVSKLRKSRKALNCKQRALKKGGNDLTESDTIELNKVTAEQSIVQKQLENARKLLRQHTVVFNEYKNKKSTMARQQMTVSVTRLLSISKARLRYSHQPFVYCCH